MPPIDQEIDRFQLSMMDLESMVDQNSYARLVDLFVHSLLLKELRSVLNLSAKIKAFISDLKGYLNKNRYNDSAFLKENNGLEVLLIDLIY